MSFNEGADFNYVSFGKNAYFNYANFSKNAYFNQATFDKNAYFKYANFSKNAYFNQATFDKNAYFDEATFGKKVYFDRATFGDYAIFAKVSFSEGADFNYASFGKNAYFNSANFSKKNAYFNQATFSGGAIFRDANFNDSASFRSAKFDSLDFYNTKISRLDLDDADFKTLKVDKWDSLKNVTHSFDGPTYVKLIKSFREMEQFDDADAAYIKYRQVSKERKNLSKSKLLDEIAWYSCGYGVKPLHAAVSAVIIIVIFTPIYGLRGGIGRSKENDEVDEQDVSFRKALLKAFKHLFDAFYFSMVTFTTIGSGDLYPADRYRKAAVVIEGLLGWLILALFIVTLANVMIRP